ncbi:transporter substrate-binding domain-containing protein [Legionella tunisiensis]|uniref:transporter substrate-binding domain-containing protein n=1 Tax=Legionella tunisiensis TaxID=1034944 RepID=UPI0002EB7728|nr:transporter substrate-binding domain-containing protein [Legionella tunisiensis]
MIKQINGFILLIVFLLLPIQVLALNKAKIGTLIYNPPYEMAILDQRYGFGFNFEVINTVCTLINYNCELVPMRFDKLMDALNSGALDAAIVGISLYLSQDRYVYTYPYFISEARILALRSSRITSLNDKTLGVVRQTLIPLYKNYILIDELNTPGQHDDLINILYFDNLPQLLSGLDNHTVDMILLDAGAAMYWQEQSSNLYEIIGPAITLPEGMRIVGLYNNQKLISLMDAALVKMENDGQLLTIYKKYWNTIYSQWKYMGKLIPQQNNHYKFHVFSVPESLVKPINTIEQRPGP